MTGIRRAIRALGACVVLSALPGAAAGAPSPVVVPGWPVDAPTTDVIANPRGGVVAHLPRAGVFGSGSEASALVTAFRADGARRWMRFLPGGCGNCSDPERPGVQPDGSFGPFGEGLNPRTVEATGRVRRGCIGVTDATGVCIDTSRIFDDDPRPVMSATADGRTRWSHWDPEFRAAFDLGPGVAMRPISDGRGTVLAAFPSEWRAATPTTLLLALDGSSGAVRWRRVVLGTWTTVTGYPGGFFIADGEHLVSLASDGTERWSVRERAVTRGTTWVDPVARRVYLQPAPTMRASARDLDTGAVVWRALVRRPVRILSVGPQGVLVAQSAGGHSVRALDPSGHTRLVIRTPTAVLGAAALADRSIVVSTADAFGWYHGLLTRYRFAARAPVPRRTTVRLVRTLAGYSCAVACSAERRGDLALRISVRTGIRMTIRVVDPRPTTRVRATVITAPRGVSTVRLGSALRSRSGAAYVRVTWRGGATTVRLPRS